MNNIQLDLEGTCLTLKTDQRLFSPDGPDKGTLAMLSQVQLTYGQKVLDLGCGYGLVGLYAAARCGGDNIWMIDKLEPAIEISKTNAFANELDHVHILQTDGPEILLESHRSSFDWILSNPPYHEDFSVARRFIETAAKLLKTGGRLVIVVKRRKWYSNKMKSVFGGVRVVSINGYYVLTAERRITSSKKDQQHKKTTKKHLKKIRNSEKTHQHRQNEGVS